MTIGFNLVWKPLFLKLTLDGTHVGLRLLYLMMWYHSSGINMYLTVGTEVIRSTSLYCLSKHIFVLYHYPLG